ncbi:hypothetical protein [Nocardia neocaledoniensis]|uniref:hypothetical protein n=1 Tax=Nocardia neocaledoniensis TaxID=236511 RepID=UPI0024571AB3|nr:hypothetical protein [Nocardia neocaledoniensis]
MKDELTRRAERRSMRIGRSADGYVLASPFRVLVIGSLADIDAWLTAAESHDRDRRPIVPRGRSADF